MISSVHGVQEKKALDARVGKPGLRSVITVWEGTML
jgi:hypothetical protein